LITNTSQKTYFVKIQQYFPNKFAKSLQLVVKSVILLKEIINRRRTYMSRFVAFTAPAGRAVYNAWKQVTFWRAEDTQEYVLKYRRRIYKVAGACQNAVLKYYLLTGAYTDGVETITTYGVSVVSYSSGTTCEAVAKDICTNMDEAMSLLRLLKKHRVTPVTLHDVVEDWLC
jgi:hypothetical protein